MMLTYMFDSHLNLYVCFCFADYRFRIRLIAGTEEIRTTIGQLCFWTSVVYGNGIFMTITPGERHNYLAIRLSRYRGRDPYITSARGDASERS